MVFLFILQKRLDTRKRNYLYFVSYFSIPTFLEIHKLLIMYSAFETPILVNAILFHF